MKSYDLKKKPSLKSLDKKEAKKTWPFTNLKQYPVIMAQRQRDSLLGEISLSYRILKSWYQGCQHCDNKYSPQSDGFLECIFKDHL